MITGAAADDPGSARRVDAGRLPLFCDTALAERIERAEAQLIAEASQAARRRQAATAGFVIPVSGGVASSAEQGSPFNKVAGLASAACRLRLPWMKLSGPSPSVALRCRSRSPTSPIPRSAPC